MQEAILNRRQVLLGAGAVAAAPLLIAAKKPNPKLTITGMEVFVVKVNQRGDWVFVRLKTDRGVTGIGEASHGGTNEAIKQALGEFFPLVQNRSPFDIEAYRHRVREKAKTDALYAGASSAIEQAMLDIIGRALEVPVHQLLGGGKLRDELAVYANINRATTDRSPEGFAKNAQAAVQDGFRAIKAAVFDDFPLLTAPPEELQKKKELGIARAEAIRQAIGPDIDFGVDCHSHFDVPLAIEVARRLEPLKLSSYEEPLPPENLNETEEIHDATRQQLSGGESLFGVEAFSPLCRNNALDIIMPDVKFCGGIKEAGKIAQLAKANDMWASPHNPSGPVSTAVNAALCARMSNFLILEYAWGEVPWRHELITPSERFVDGKLPVSDRPGFGIELNDEVAKAHA